MAGGIKEPPAPPLAEYFWIAGIDSHSYTEQIGREPLARRSRSINEEGPIAESSAEQEEEDDVLAASGSRNASGTNTPKLTLNVPGAEQRLSVASQGSGKSYANGEQSNRNSNSTITQGMLGDGLGFVTTPTGSGGLGGLADFDFDKALRKFAAERETFLDELSFSAGAIQNDKPLVPPQAKKVVNDESSLNKSGSLRRRISLRDLSSLRRAPSAIHRTGERLGIFTMLILTASSIHQIQPINKTDIQLQLRNTATSPPQSRPRHAPPQAQIRARPPRPLPHQRHAQRRTRPTDQIPRLRPHVCLPERRQHCIRRRAAPLNMA